MSCCRVPWVPRYELVRLKEHKGLLFHRIFAYMCPGDFTHVCLVSASATPDNHLFSQDVTTYGIGLLLTRFSPSMHGVNNHMTL